MTTPQPKKSWSGINWYGGWFDNEADARAYGAAESAMNEGHGGDGRYEVKQSRVNPGYPSDENPADYAWFVRVHAR